MPFGVGGGLAGGASIATFDARGAASFISKVIAVLAAPFLVNSFRLRPANLRYTTLQPDEEPAGDPSGGDTDEVSDEVALNDFGNP